MDLNDLHTVVTVQQSQSFSEAAFQLSYSASAISKHVRRVENELGFPIFARGDKSRQTTLTPQGEAVMPLIQELNAKYAELAALSNTLKSSGESGTLRVGYPYLFGTFGEVDIMSGFSADNPNVVIQYTRASGGMLVQGIMENRLDCAFLYIVGDFDPARFCAKHNLTSLDMTLCNAIGGMYVGISSKDPLAQKDELLLSELIDRPFAFWRNQGPPEKELDDMQAELLPSYRSMYTYQQYCKKHGCTPKPVMFNTMSHDVFQSAAAGRVVIPVMRIGYTYEGVKFVKVSDWENTGYLFFVSKHSTGPLLQKLKQEVDAYAATKLSEHSMNYIGSD